MPISYEVRRPNQASLTPALSKRASGSIYTSGTAFVILELTRLTTSASPMYLEFKALSLLIRGAPEDFLYSYVLPQFSDPHIRGTWVFSECATQDLCIKWTNVKSLPLKTLSGRGGVGIYRTWNTTLFLPCMARVDVYNARTDAVLVVWSGPVTVSQRLRNANRDLKIQASYYEVCNTEYGAFGFRGRYEGR